MLNLPGNEILTIAFILFGAVCLSQFMPYKSYPKIDKLTLERILIALWVAIVFFLIAGMFSIFGMSDFITKDNEFLISGNLIALSALLASVSTMKSIKNTNIRDLYDRRLDAYQMFRKKTNRESIKLYLCDIQLALNFREETITIEFLYSSEIVTDLNKLRKDLVLLSNNHILNVVNQKDKLQKKPNMPKKEKSSILLIIKNAEIKEKEMMSNFLHNCKHLEHKMKIELNVT